MMVNLKIILIAGLYFAGAGPSFAQKVISDKQLINDEIYRLNYNMVKGDMDIKRKSDSSFVDSLAFANKHYYREGHVTFATDRTFKIFVLEGEDCGASCSNMYQSIVYLGGKKLDADFTHDFLPVTRIIKIKNDEYLVLQKGQTGSNIYINDNQVATLLTLHNNLLMVTPIKFTHENEHMGPKGSLCISQNQFVTEDQDNILKKFGLTINPKTKQLRYYFIQKPTNTEKAYLYTGYFNLVNGVFVQRSDKKSLLK